MVATTQEDLYTKCGSIDKVCELLGKIPQRNEVSWNAMVIGKIQNGLFSKTLETFKIMQLAGVNPNSITFASIIPMCRKIVALEQDMEIHQSIKWKGSFWHMI